MSKIIKIFEVINDCNSRIATIRKELDEAQDTLKNWLLDYNFRNYISEKIIEGMTPEQVEKMKNERNRREENKKKTYTNPNTGEEYSNSTYYITNIFDPQIDSYSLYGIKVENNKVKIEVDVHKNRQHLGCAGGYIPDIRTTSWIDIDEINEKIENIK